MDRAGGEKDEARNISFLCVSVGELTGPPLQITGYRPNQGEYSRHIMEDALYTLT